MIDLHNHVLPGIDDGAKSLDISVAMIEQAVECGVTHIVCTPHIHYGYFDNSLATIEPAFNRLQSVVRENGLPITLSYAAEVRADEFLAEGIKHQALPFIGQYKTLSVLLFEMPHSHVPVGIEQLISWLMARKVLPLIAHPERNRELQRKPEMIQRLRRLGVLFQLTAGSIIGRFGDKPHALSEFMLSQGYVDVVASDSHDTTKRPNDMKSAYESVENYYSESLARQLFVTMPATLLQKYVVKPLAR